MKTAGICFLILGGILLLLAGFYYCVYLIFENHPHKTSRTLGRLSKSKYKQDVHVWGGLGKYDGPPRIAFTIKHLTKTKYIYNVNNKLYACTFDFLKKPRHVPSTAWVTYLKAFPGISYLSDSENYTGTIDFLGKAMCLLGIAICSIGFGIALLTRL